MELRGPAGPPPDTNDLAVTNELQSEGDLTLSEAIQTWLYRSWLIVLGSLQVWHPFC